jgi:SagB-type dehydrogenase family enzyme
MMIMRINPLIVCLLAIIFAGTLALLYRGYCADAPQCAGELFHAQTQISLSSIARSLVGRASEPAKAKRYKGAAMVKLPKPVSSGMPLEEALQKRRSVRNYTREPLLLSELSLLLFAGQGITGSDQGQALRTAPSAGALYPMEIYIVALRVDGLKQGLYHYAADSHSLELVKEGNFSSGLTDAALEQEMVAEAAASLVLTAVFGRTTHKYGERGYRYAYMEAGHISQNISLQATALGLGSVCVGAFFDDKLNGLLGLDGRTEAAIYIHCVGRT